MKVGVLGAGRIGKVHIKNITAFVPEIEIKTVVDPYLNKETIEFVKSLGITNIGTNPRDIFDDEEIEAVLICSSTNTHADFIIEAAQAKKHIFCEKPVDNDLAKAKLAVQTAKDEGVLLQLGFVRRFDHNHKAVHDMVRGGKIGDVQMVKISSRDPEAPPVEYVKISGGIFNDMMIHDFDMARFLSGSDALEVHAYGSVLINPEIGEAGDVDTTMVTIKFENGALGYIDNSRQAVYGYDQRVEVFGSKGAAENQNDIPNTAVLTTADGTTSGTAYKVMWDRYTNAFADEIKAFAKAVKNGEQPPVGGEDALKAMLMALASQKSLDENRPVKISEVG